MTIRSAVHSIAAMALAALLLAAVPAGAQFSEGYNFLKAFRDRDINAATDLVTKPGSTVINSRDPGTGETPLIIAVRRHDLPWTAFALVHGADMGMRDNKGDTALIAATRIGYVEGAQMLLKVGAAVDGQDSRGETPLVLAVQARDLDMSRLLVSYGASPYVTDHVTGQSALDYARGDPRAGAIVALLQQAKPQARGPVVGPQP